MDSFNPVVTLPPRSRRALAQSHSIGVARHHGLILHPGLVPGGRLGLGAVGQASSISLHCLSLSPSAEMVFLILFAAVTRIRAQVSTPMGRSPTQRIRSEIQHTPAVPLPTVQIMWIS